MGVSAAQRHEEAGLALFEAFRAPRLSVLLDDRVHGARTLSCRRVFAKQGEQRIDVSPLTFSNDLDAAVFEVFGVAGEAKLLGLGLDPETEANALDVAVDMGSHPCVTHTAHVSAKF